MVTFVIKTEILSFDPQPGMKSQQTLNINFSEQRVHSSFVTGQTHVGPISLDSVRNSFTVSDARFAGTSVTFNVVGQTATGVRVLPNIDYSMQFAVNADGSGEISGAHDGYPAYSVKQGTQVIYQYNHKSMELWRLAGTSDVTFGPLSFGRSS